MFAKYLVGLFLYLFLSGTPGFQSALQNIFWTFSHSGMPAFAKCFLDYSHSGMPDFAKYFWIFSQLGLLVIG